MTRQRRRSQGGFTLLELMTVMVIISVITVTLATMSGSGGQGTPATFSDQVAGVFQFARLRAEARRTTHRVQVTDTSITVFENTTTGFTAFDNVNPRFVQQLQIPSGVVVWSAEATLQVTASGATPTQNAGFPFNIDFKLDGRVYAHPASGVEPTSPTPATVYVTDRSSVQKHRVFVYRTTGSTMAREDW